MSATLAITGSNLCGGAAFSVAVAASGGVHQQSVPRGERGDLAALCRDVCRAAGLAADAITDVVVDVGPDGGVTANQVSASTMPESVDRCVSSVGHRTRFPTASGASTVTIPYSFSSAS